jgi:hydrogenase expression/formation protein HypD
MRHVDEYRDAAAIAGVVRRIRATASRRWALMEVCGGQTHSILKFGMDELLPETVELVHGPGCPVCVTPLELLDRAIAIAGKPEVIFCSFGDMLRVPGSGDDLLKVKARGGDVRIVYSPLDALRLAKQHPERKVVFFAVGFETTAPANAMAVHSEGRGSRTSRCWSKTCWFAGAQALPAARRADRRPARTVTYGDGLSRLRGDRRAAFRSW